jgi:hypothetical protein
MTTAAKRTWRILGGVFLLWIAAYGVNRSFGGYDMMPVISRETLPDGAEDIKFLVKWQPRYGAVRYGEPDAMGQVFYPLVWLDQKFLHPDIDVTESEGFHRATSLDVEKVHPRHRAEFAAALAAQEGRERSAPNSK